MKSNNDIPKFDLTEQIMVEQRKTASVKRKAPQAIDRKPQKKNKSLEDSPQISQNKPVSDIFSLGLDNPCEKIISEIVARDIKKFRSR